MAFKPILPHSLSDHHLAEMRPEATPGLPCAHIRPSRHTVKQKEVMETTLHCSSQRIWERKLVLNDSYLKLWTMGKNYFLCYVGMRLILFVLVFEELRWKVVRECKILPLLSWKGEAYTPKPPLSDPSFKLVQFHWYSARFAQSQHCRNRQLSVNPVQL